MKEAELLPQSHDLLQWVVGWKQW